MPSVAPAPLQGAPSLSPSRKRRLSFKILTAPFRRSHPAATGPTPPVFPLPLDSSPLVSDFQPVKGSVSTRTGSILSRKFRRRSLPSFGSKADKVAKEVKEAAARAEEQQVENEKENRHDELEERPKTSSINWVKRTANEPLPSEAANIREQWLKEQYFGRPPPMLAVELDHRASITSVGSLLFPSASQGQQLDIFSAPPPRAVENEYSPYANSTISAASQRDDLVRDMAKPLPSGTRSVGQVGEAKRTSLIGPTPEDEMLQFMFPTPPPRQSDLPTPPASPHRSPIALALTHDPSKKPELSQVAPFDHPTPPHTPQRRSFVESPVDVDGQRDSAPSRRASSAVSGDAMAAAAAASSSTVVPTADRRRPLSLTLAPSATIPIFTRGSISQINRLTGHVRSSSVVGPSTSSSSLNSNLTGTTTPTCPPPAFRRPVSIAPGLGGRRMSQSFASTISGAPLTAPGGDNRKSWASVQSVTPSISSSVSIPQAGPGAGGGVGGGTGNSLLAEVRRRAEEREQKGRSNRESLVAVQREEEQHDEGSRDEDSESEDAEKRGTWEHEAEEMFSDARMEALVRELGI